ncbi:MAG TPA: hypothetical protein VHW90_03990 [Stellaceae bacterium]|jgi:hypothetical protein|nr:hypothetical protein [Stellaceae bacterium]
MVALERELPAVVAAPPPTADAIPLQLRRHGGSPRQVLAMSLVGALFLAAFASRDLSSWLDRLGHGPRLAPLQHSAAQWDKLMDHFGLTRPEDILRHELQRLLDWEWRSS